MRAATCIWLVAALTGCRTKSELRVERIGTSDVQPFAIVGGDVLAVHHGLVERLGPDGQLRWRTAATGTWAVPRGSGPAFVATKMEQKQKTSLLEVDMTTGIVTPRGNLDGSQWNDWYRVGDALIGMDSSELNRVDPATQTILWSKYVDGFGTKIMPGGDRIWVGNQRTTRGYSIADGSFRELAVGYESSLTPDGLTLVTDFGDNVVAFDTHSLQRTWTRPGPPPVGTGVKALAASDRWVLALFSSMVTRMDTLIAYRRSDGELVWWHSISKRHAEEERSWISLESRKELTGEDLYQEYFGYIAAGGDLIAYYDSRDSAIHAVHLPDGKTAVVHKFISRMVLSPERSGISSALPHKASVIDGDIILVNDFGDITAYRVTAQH